MSDAARRARADVEVTVERVDVPPPRRGPGARCRAQGRRQPAGCRCREALQRLRQRPCPARKDLDASRRTTRVFRAERGSMQTAGARARRPAIDTHACNAIALPARS